MQPGTDETQHKWLAKWILKNPEHFKLDMLKNTALKQFRKEYKWFENNVTKFYLNRKKLNGSKLIPQEM